MQMDTETKCFYDEFWPKNVQYYDETKKYMLRTISEKEVEKSLDAGCGPGVCTVILSEISKKVTAVDISPASLETAKQVANKFNRSNIEFINADLQFFSPAEKYDFVWCWGVAMMAPDPMKVIHNIMDATKPGGVLYLGLYLKTWLSPIHQLARHFCRKFMNTPRRKQFVLDFFAWLTKAICKIKGKELNLRADNVSIQAQADDWFYPPYKTFYSIKEIVSLLNSNGFDAECIQDQVGRFKSTTIFVVRAVKKKNT